TGKKGALLELHFLAHAFNVFNIRYSGGPILLNSLGNPFITERFVLDKDCRADKDFREPTMNPATFSKAFANDAKSFVWGCNFQRGFIRQFVHQMGKNGKVLVDKKDMNITFNADWGEEDEFRSRLGLAPKLTVKNVSVNLAKSEQVLRDA